ncbi:MAG TPA: AAA family ATPase [Actinobacteria bacterium]|nr:AAA family ATPase [Actinomycetota bacterium]
MGRETDEVPGAEGSDWRIYLGDGTTHDGLDRLPPPPPWRAYSGGPLITPEFGTDDAAERRLGSAGQASAYRADENVVRMVNAALYLRRPLLVTGKPGTGKSTLAYSIAYELKLGPVLSWPITSRSTLGDGLYQYDALGRLQDANLQQFMPDPGTPGAVQDVGHFVRLGPLGTALLPQARPRVLLIDELDKSDIDLPNDLLHVFEDGRFDIGELARLPDSQSPAWVFTADVDSRTADGRFRVPIDRGRVTCNAFPIVVITSNAEREFPAAFQRRCMRLTIQPPGREKLAAIVAAQLGAEAAEQAGPIIGRFLDGRERGDIATDQLLNAIYFATSGAQVPETSFERLEQALLSPLGAAGVR